MLHSSEVRRLHFDAFYNLLHSGPVAFLCILMHPKGPLHVDAFATWCIHGVMHCTAFWCICNSCIIVHSWLGAFICIFVHSCRFAFYIRCIWMHLYASTHKVHSVDTLHSDALAFLRIQAHSDAFTHTRIQGECRPPKGLAQLQDAFMCVHPCEFGLESARRLLCMCGPRVRRICVHLCAFWRILTYLCAFSRIM